MENYFLKITGRKNAYKFIFYIFSLCGICMNFIIDGRLRNKISQSILVKSLNIILMSVSVLQLIPCFSVLLQSTPKSKKASVIYTCICMIYILFRICLYKSFHTLIKVAKSVNHISRNIRNTFNIPCWVYIWIFTVLCFIIVTFFQITCEITIIMII